MSQYQNAAITADTLLFCITTARIALVRRSGEPFANFWALPGGFFNAYDTPENKADMSIEEAGLRELLEEGGIDLLTHPDVIVRGFIGVWDGILRDPRGRVVTHAYFATTKSEIPLFAGDDAADAQWFAVADILLGKIKMAFDHQDIVRKFMKRT